MTDETYNGYANRETWAFNLHWQNDQGLYNETLSVAREYIANGNEDDRTDYRIGELVVEYWRELMDSDVFTDDAGVRHLTRDLQMFRDEVGSWWRIDYAEVGAAVRESLEVEGE